MKTTKQIADEIGVSRQAVQKRISKEPLNTKLLPYIKIKKGIKYIDETGEDLIKSVYESYVTEATSETNNTAINATKTTHATEGIATHAIEAMSATDGIAPFLDHQKEIFNLLREDINILKEQLKVKDKQLEAKDDQIKLRDIQISDLTTIIKTQAESIAAAQQTTRAEQLLHADTKGMLSSGADPAESKEPEPEKKRGFFKKMFGKNK